MAQSQKYPDETRWKNNLKYNGLLNERLRATWEKRRNVKIKDESLMYLIKRG